MTPPQSELSSPILDALRYLGLLSLPFTVFLGWTKLGHRVGASFTWTSKTFQASGISAVTLFNLKDRSLAIFQVFAVTGKHLVFDLGEFDPPLILKAYEATNVKVNPVSDWTVNGEAIEWHLSGPGEIEIYVVTATSRRAVRCVWRGRERRLSFSFRREMQPVVGSRHMFGGRLINDEALFAVRHFNARRDRVTSLIDPSGHIDWGLTLNRIPDQRMASRETVLEALNSIQLKDMFGPFEVTDLRTRTD